MPKRIILFSLLAAILLCLAAGVAYNLPPIHDRVAWRMESLITRVRYAFDPPQQAVFVPQQQQAQMDEIVRATLVAFTSTLTAAAPLPVTPTATLPGPTDTPTPQPTPTLVPTPIPGEVTLKGVIHEYQQLNNCGPATLAMALSYWGWQGDQRDTRRFLRPNFKEVDDKNVNASEMASFVETQTELKAAVRVGGDIETVKRFIAAGIPVIIEHGLQQHANDWLGHYVLITGYDDERQRFLTQDSLIMADLPVDYATLDEHWWRDFNYAYIVIYPAGREAEVMALLGPQADVTENYRYAAQKARDETGVLSGRDLYFAWYNLGTNLVALEDYAGAAAAYDQAFSIYPSIPEEDRPWRMLWYQTGPYPAYYYTGRYDDVVNLGNQTLSQLGKPILEETLYWLGMAREGQGDMEKAIYDLQRAYALNPNSTSALQELQRLGAAQP